MISLLCPSRYRPSSLLMMLESASETAWKPSELEACVRLDDDDPNVDLYKALPMPFSVTWIVGERITLSECWNQAATQSSGEILMLAADDIRFRTPGWDLLVTEAFKTQDDHIALVYGADGIANDRMATHPFMHRKWYETVGYFVPGIFCGDHCDLWLDEVARAIDRNMYLDNLYIEHLHPSNGKADLDMNHRERIDRMERENPYQIYLETESQRIDDAEKLRAVMG